MWQWNTCLPKPNLYIYIYIYIRFGRHIDIDLYWTYYICPQGYVQRQALYACATCSVGDEDLAGICLACSLECHDGHELFELYTKVGCTIVVILLPDGVGMKVLWFYILYSLCNYCVLLFSSISWKQLATRIFLVVLENSNHFRCWVIRIRLTSLIYNAYIYVDCGVILCDVVSVS